MNLKDILLKVQKPSRYTGGEFNSVVKDKEKIRFCFCFPDTYEVGMSHLGMKILYGLLNHREDVWCERAFAPWVDMEEQMREHDIKLYGLESKDSLDKFDILGFTLQTELSYTNILNMLNLSGLPLKTSDRDNSHPLVIAGGPCAYNPEPLWEFIDLFVIGDGEEVIGELIDLYKEHKDNYDRNAFLKEAVKIEGIYVPSLVDVSYNDDGTVRSISGNVKRRIINDMDNVYYPDKFVLPFCEIVHDRIMVELFRGCGRGCRFCQAGAICRPVREKSPEVVNRQAKLLFENTGYEEISLTSLSTSDYSGLDCLIDKLLSWCEKEKVSLSLPSLRVDNFNTTLMKKIQSVRKSGLTFAPEAGSQRLRDIINKNVTEEDLLRTCDIAFDGGWTSIKLYFMIGLPYEKEEDIVAITELARKVVEVFYSKKRNVKKSVSVTVSAASFVPKPFTPFEREPQDSFETLLEKQKILKLSNRSKKVTVNWHGAEISFLEGVYARGDRRLSKALLKAFENGAKFDNWDEHLKYDVHIEAIKSARLEPEFYANRKRADDEILPWSFIDAGVSQKFLTLERDKAVKEATTVSCMDKCSNCGILAFSGECKHAGKN